jgi:nucleotide-binding universal stress UspA family protein
MTKTKFPHRILVATDFSPESFRALALAAKMALPVKGTVHLLHVLELPYTVQISREKLRSSLGSSAEGLLKEQVKMLSSTAKMPKKYITTEIIEGKPVPEIVRKASSGSFDLICIGNHISNTLSSLVFDNTTAGVIDLAPCAVLTATTRRPETGISRIMMASNFREGDLDLLGEVIGIAKNLKCKVDVVHVTHHPEFESRLKMAGMEQLSGQTLDTRQVFFRYMHGEEIMNGLPKAVESLGSDLVVVGRESRGILNTLFGSDFIHEMVYRLEIPVLVFPLPAKAQPKPSA